MTSHMQVGVGGTGGTNNNNNNNSISSLNRILNQNYEKLSLYIRLYVLFFLALTYLYVCIA